MCSEPLVRTQADSWELIQREPVTSRYVSLDEGEQILVEALCPGTALCADGNPLKILSEGDVVEIGVKRRAVTAMRLGESANQRINESANQRIGNRQSPGARGSRPWPSWGDSRAMIHESFRRPSLACAGRRWR
ncbi:MAG: hypothetical protein FJ026_13540 [Chloroflexi bacterium]|nr:hypothetical protein [Chloroflexota bacterium]